MIQFTKAAAYIPDPVRSRPVITDEDKALAAEDPPYPVRLHCKPWMDGQSVGWTLFYGYLTPITVVGLGDGDFRVENLEQLKAESQVDNIIMPLVGGYFGMPATGYTFLTQPGIISLILPAPNAPPDLHLEPGIIETDWYPLEMPAVFKVPPKGEAVTLDYKMEIARLVPIPRLESMTLTPMAEDDLNALLKRRQEYIEDRGKYHGKTVQMGVIKQSYKKWSAEYRRQNTPHDSQS
ncbi:MAG: DUF6065 family protein [Candidatus Promineifilaceae bacterium]